MTVTAPASAQQLNGQSQYHYDALYQLVRLTDPGGTYNAWTYDAIGNRLTASQSGAVTSYAYLRYPANPNQNSSRLQSAGSTQYLYDANGNVTSAGGGAYTWNASNQLVSAGGESYAYDYTGRRTTGGPASNPSNFIYQGLQAVRERKTASNSRIDFVFGPGIDEPLAKRDSATGVVTYYAVEGLGSIAVEIEGTTIARGTYYGAFGEPQGVALSSFGYTAREPAAPGYYYRARYYSPAIGRFLSEDPPGTLMLGSVRAALPNTGVDESSFDLEDLDPNGLARFHVGDSASITSLRFLQSAFDDGTNLYAYVWNDPANATDPLGLFMCMVTPLAPKPNPKKLKDCLSACEKGIKAREAFCRKVRNVRARAGCWAIVLASDAACKGWCYYQYGK